MFMIALDKILKYNQKENQEFNTLQKNESFYEKRMFCVN